MKLLPLLFLVVYGEIREPSFVDLKVDLSKPKERHFPSIYSQIRSHEGNYVWHPHDKGSETYGGISRKLHPSWYGWKYIDQAKPIKRHQLVSSAEPWVTDFYLTIWVQENFELIEDRELALNLFDFRIHSSPRTVEKLTNRVLNEMGYCSIKVGGMWINEDFNHLDSREFVLRLKIQRIQLFNYLVRKDANQVVFYKGWINRLNNI